MRTRWIPPGHAKFFLMAAVAVPGAMVPCCWSLRLMHLCPAWTLLGVRRHWGSQSSSCQTQSPCQQTWESGLAMSPFALGVTDLMDCLVVGSLGWPAHHRIVSPFWACPACRRFSRTCISSMLVPSTVHAFVVDWRVMVAAGSVLSTAMMSMASSLWSLQHRWRLTCSPWWGADFLSWLPFVYSAAWPLAVWGLLCSKAVLISRRLPHQHCLAVSRTRGDYDTGTIDDSSIQQTKEGSHAE